jgi:hypothetical protein
MNKDTKILCVCRAGNVRSVETKKRLNEKGYFDVIAIGGLVVSPKTLNLLCNWADIILLAKSEHGKYIEEKYRDKINLEFNIGDDMEQITSKALERIEL